MILGGDLEVNGPLLEGEKRSMVAFVIGIFNFRTLFFFFYFEKNIYIFFLFLR